MSRKHICTLLLVSLLTSSVMTGCGADSGTNETTNTNDTTETTAAIVEETEPDRANTPDSLPDGLDFGGNTVCIHGRGDESSILELTSELTGDVVDDAIYYRNLSVEERLNITLEAFTPYGWQNYSQAVTQVRASVQAGDDQFQIVAGYSAPFPLVAVDGILNNLHEIPHVDVSQPWWAKSIVEELTINDHLDFLCGDIALTMLSSSYCVAINFDIAGDYGVEDVYSLVQEGKWTIDKMGEIAAGVYEDTDGDGTKTSADVVGLLVGNEIRNDADAFLQGSMITLTSRDANGIPQLDADLEKLTTLTEKVYALFYENDGSIVDQNILAYEKFPESTALFTPAYMVLITDYFRDMEADYGILPYPKFDEAQASYSTRVQDGVSIWCVPITVQDVECAGATLEAMAAESYRTVTPAYFEVALKAKYSRDEQSFQMLDIIRDGVMFNFEIIYNNQIGGPWNILRDLMAGKDNNFASAWASKEKGYKSALEELVENFK